MKLYRVSISSQKECHEGYVYCASRVEAAEHETQYLNDGKDKTTYELLKIGRTKAEVLSFLNRFASHPDNG